jgi:asparagine synthase (glutamine-hydrolysing)
MGFSYRELLRDFVFEPERRRVHELLARGGFLPLSYLSSDFTRQSGFAADLATRAEPLLSAPRNLRAFHHHALTDPILPFYLEVYDKVAASLGVEHRHPYFDRPLMEFCLALPSDQRLFQGWDRVIQRRAFTGLIPEPIRARQSKSVWTRNFERQLLGGGHHHERIRALIEGPASPLAGYCDLARLRRDLPQLKAGKLPERVMDFWAALSLGLWLEGQAKSARCGGQV